MELPGSESTTSASSTPHITVDVAVPVPENTGTQTLPEALELEGPTGKEAQGQRKEKSEAETESVDTDLPDAKRQRGLGITEGEDEVMEEAEKPISAQEIPSLEVCTCLRPHTVIQYYTEPPRDPYFYCVKCGKNHPYVFYKIYE
jgi:hypothetical protein